MRIKQRLDKLEASHQGQQEPQLYVLVADEPEPVGVRPGDIVIRVTPEQKKWFEREVENTPLPDDA